MTYFLACPRAKRNEAHAPHLWSLDSMPATKIVSCHGTDPEPLAPERDRPQGPEFDWTPETLNLTAAAAIVVRHHRDYDVNEAAGAYQRYRLVVTLWAELCGIDEAASLTYAYSIADAVPPVMGTAVPF